MGQLTSGARGYGGDTISGSELAAKDKRIRELENQETAIKFKVTKGIDMHLAIGQACWDKVKDDIGTEYRIKITKGEDNNEITK